jgi:hypothetical protein
MRARSGFAFSEERRYKAEANAVRVFESFIVAKCEKSLERFLIMRVSDNLNPDLGEHQWHEEGGFFHGYLNGVYYRMVCSRAELEEAHQEASEEEEKPLDTDEIWWRFDERLDPDDSHYGPFEPDSPFEEDLDFDARRRLVAVNMCLDPNTATWYGLSHHYGILMRLPQRKRAKVLLQRLRDFGLDPQQVKSPEVRRLWALALEYGLNPFQATETDILQCQFQLHKVAIPDALANRAFRYLYGKPLTFPGLLLLALEAYLTQQQESEKTA